MNPWGTAVILPTLLTNITEHGKWQVKLGCLEILQQLVVSAPVQMAAATPELIPVLSAAVWDTKSDVKKAAKATLTKSTQLVENKDIEKLIPEVSSASHVPRRLSDWVEPAITSAHPCGARSTLEAFRRPSSLTMPDRQDSD